jgi:predicted RNase H-like HicB family nuclease
MVIKSKKKELDFYLNLPWTYTIEIDKDNKGHKIYIVSVNELNGIKTDALTLEEAMENIKEAMLATFELYIELGKEIPIPINEEEFKGNIAYRTSTKRHYLLAKEAKKRKLSLSRLLDEVVDTVFSKK